MLNDGAVVSSEPRGVYKWKGQNTSDRRKKLEENRVNVKLAHSFAMPVQLNRVQGLGGFLIARLWFHSHPDDADDLESKGRIWLANGSMRRSGSNT
jgi:hypothetical protein